MTVSRILERFREVFRRDLERGGPRPVEHYQRLFRGFESAVTQEYTHLSMSEADTAERRAASRESLTAAGVEDADDALRKLSDPAAERYETGDEIARGGMGAILRARDARLNRDLAMKVILDPDFRRRRDSTPRTTPFVNRFLAEAQVTAQLDHPGVVPVHDLGLDGEGRLFFTMKFVNGRTLGEIFHLVHAGREQWTATRAVQLIVRVLETLSFAHTKGVVHRDLKPANIMVGDFGEVYVMDWGLAKVLSSGAEEDLGGAPDVADTGSGGDSVSVTHGSHLTMAGTVLGTPSYMSPEQAMGRLGDLDARSDVYSTGAMLYELLVGAPPYADQVASRKPMDVIVACANRPATPVTDLAPHVPGEIAAIVDKAMAREPSTRYGSAEEMAQDLRDFIEGRAVSAYRTGPLVELRKWIGRNRALAGAIGVAFALLVGGLVTSYALLQDSRAEARNSRRQAYRLGMDAVSRAIAEGDRGTARAKLDGSPTAARGWEWAHFDARLRDAQLELEGLDATFDAEGRLIVVGVDGSVSRRDLGSGGVETLLPASEGRVVALSGDAAALVMAFDPVDEGSEGRVRVLDTLTAATLAEVDAPPSTVASFADDAPAVVLRHKARAWHVDLATGAVAGPTESPFATYLRVRTRDGLLAAGSASEGRVVVVDERDGAVRRTLVGHSERPLGASFSADGEELVTCSRDGRAIAWRVADGEVLWRFALDSSDDLVGVEHHPGGEIVAVSSVDESTRLLRRRDGTLARVVFDSTIYSPRFSPDGRFLVATNRKRRVVLNAVGDGEDPSVLRGHTSFAYALAFSPDGRRLASAGWDGFAGSEPGCVRFWDAASGAPIGAWGGPDTYATSLAWSPDGRRLYVTVQDDAHVGAVVVLDADSGTEVDRIEGGCSVALSPDGGTLVTGKDARTARTSGWVYDLRGGGSRRDAAFYSFAGGGLRFLSSDVLACGSPEYDVVLLDVATLDPIRRLRGHSQGVFGFATDRAGRRLVTTSDDGTARVWDVATGDELAVLSGHGSGALGVTVSPDDARIFTGGRDGNVHVWHADTYEEVATLRGHRAYVTALAMAPDGETLVSASGDGTLRYWTTYPLDELFARRAARDARIARLRPAFEELCRAHPDATGAAAAVRNDAALSDDDRETLLQLVLAEHRDR